MGRRSTEGAGLLDAFGAAVANLEAHVDEVNDLNVFPVPDGDTGSNMLATVHAALAEAERLGDAPVDRVVAAISYGALMGARGNSGVITSQILRGFADALQGKRRINALDLAHAFREGSRTAYAAVARPVEGTILTVVREAADAAVAQAEQTNDIETVLAVTVDAAERSVARTPSLLPILREAGVVDSGGQGLYRLLQGALQLVVGRNPAPLVRREQAVVEPAALVAHADEGFGYETMFLLQAPHGRPLDLDTLRRTLEAIGDSVLVAGDARAAKVHVHSERPDRVIALGLDLGTLSRITVENLDHQARDVREARAAEFTATRTVAHAVDVGALSDEVLAGPAGGAAGAVGANAAAAAAGVGSDAPAAAGSAVAVASRPDPPSVPVAAGPVLSGDRNGTLPVPVGIVAVAAGDGLRQVFQQFAVPDHLEVRVVRGGQSLNPSTGELLEALGSLRAGMVLVLPNNPNVVLAARQVVELADGAAAVVPTRNAAEGVAALLALDPSESIEANVEAMTDAARSIQSIQVTEAVRDARIGDRKVRRGQTIALDPDDGLIAVDGDRLRAIVAAVEAFAPGYELLTVYYGEGADLDEAEAVAHRIGEAVDGAEVQLVHGGQPHYRYLISAE
jgi:dihydroxyacetone kinase-like predicted kinase